MRRIFFIGALVILQASVLEARVNHHRLLKELSLAPPAERPLMIRALGRSKRKAVLGALTERLRGPFPPAEKLAAAAAVGDLGFEEGAAPLAAAWDEALFSEDADFKAAIADSLGKCADPRNARAVSVFRRAAADLSPKVAAAGLAGLGMILDSGSVPELSSRLKDDRPGVSRAAAMSLAALGVEGPLLEGRESRLPRRRIDAACALGRMGVKTGSLILEGFLEEYAETHADGLAAASCLAALGKANGLDYLSGAARSGENGLRRLAVEELGRSGSERAVLPLAELLEDRESEIRAAVVSALEALGGDRAAFHLRRLKSDPALREAARRARAVLGDYEPP